ncbi:MAG: phage terminase large subunit family protein [Rickettsia endosymbiont of Platyusa sonomae]|nr:phage terminase large subunit family protein [Rickettsia endosymbiont of Platyusa sonomae]
MITRIAKLVAPPPKLLVSTWADCYRKLSSESSAESGSWRANNAPYQREIMDAVCNPNIEMIIVNKSSPKYILSILTSEQIERNYYNNDYTVLLVKESSGEFGARSDGATPISNRRALSDNVTNFSSIDYKAIRRCFNYAARY